MVFSFLNTSLFLYQIWIFFVVTILFLLFLLSSVLSWNMEKLKCFTFLDSEEILTYLLWVLPHLKVLSFFLKTYGDISAFSLIENYCSDNTSTFIPIKPFLLSSVWKYWEIQQETLTLFKKDSFIGVVCCL